MAKGKKIISLISAVLILVSIGLIIGWKKSAHASNYDGPAELPRVYVNTTFPSQPSATVYNVASGDPVDLQNQINLAASHCGSIGAVVNVPAGAVYDATQLPSNRFNLPSTNCDATHWVIIQSASLSSLPSQGTRISTSTEAQYMPTLTTTGVNGAIEADDVPSQVASTCPSGGTCGTPHNYWLAGLNITATNTGREVYYLAQFGDYCDYRTDSGCPITTNMTAANLASHFTVDRSWIHGANINANVRAGIDYDASYLAVEDSVISDIHSYGEESHGINTWNSFGPIDIGNNDISVASIPIFFGGADPIIPNVTPSDIFIHNNYIHKNTAWQGMTYVSKDFFECKNCQRALVEGNVFDTTWNDIFTYASIQLGPRNQGGAPWSVVQDVTFRYNTFANLNQWLWMFGANGLNNGGHYPTLPVKRISVHDNVVENLNYSYPGTPRWIEISPGDASAVGCSGVPDSPACEVSDISITHNTLAGSTSSQQGVLYLYAGLTGGVAPSGLGYNLNISNNIVPAGQYAFNVDSGIYGTLSTDIGYYFSSFTFDNNAIAGLAQDGFYCRAFPPPTSNFCPPEAPGVQPSTMDDIGFVNYNNGIGGDYHLCHGPGNPSPSCTAASLYMNAASDGTDVGANIDLVNSNTAGVVAGNPGSVTVITPTSYLLSTATSGTGTGTVSGGGTYTAGSSVSLTATPGSGSTFAGWSGGGCSGTGTCTVTLNANTTVTASFSVTVITPTSYLLSTATSGTGTGTVSGGGTYTAGSSVSLTATPGSGSTFAGWSGGGCSGTGTCTVTLNANTTVTASFSVTVITPTSYLLSTATSGTGTGTVSGGGTYTAGSSVSLTATPGSGSTFAGWSGGGCSGTGTCTVTLNANTTVTASFSVTVITPTSYLLSTATSGTGTGTVSGGGTYTAGSSVSLTATPGSGSTFAGWSGGGCSGTGTCTVTLNANTTVTASFSVTVITPTSYLLSTATSGTGTGTVSGGGTYTAGSSVSLTATPGSGSTFAGWSGGGCSGTGTCTVTLNANTTVTASFSVTATVSITSPLPGATLSGTTSLTASISSEANVTGLGLYIDGLFSESESDSPYTFPINTTVLSNGTHVLSVKVYYAGGGVIGAGDVSVTVANNAGGGVATTTAPVATTTSIAPIVLSGGGANTPSVTVSITSPLPGATISGTTSLTASISSETNVTGLGLYIDGLFSESESDSPYTFPINTTVLSNGTHVLSVKVYYAGGGVIGAGDVSVTVANNAGGGVATTTAPVATVATATTTSNAPITFSRALTYGDTGSDVQNLQTVLVNLGYLTASASLTQFFGTTTQHALLLFQNAHGLNKTEVLDAPTLALLNKVVAANQSLLGKTATSTQQATSSTPLLPVTVTKVYFARNLTVGAVGADVENLQKYLNSSGYIVAKSGIGSPGNESTYFGTKTAAALAKYQAAKGIAPAAGYFGPKTRTYVNLVI